MWLMSIKVVTYHLAPEAIQSSYAAIKCSNKPSTYGFGACIQLTYLVSIAKFLRSCVVVKFFIIFIL